MFEADDSNFEDQVLKSDKPVLVEFGAEWCGPCQKQLPILKELSESADWGDKVAFGKVDVDKSPQTARQYRIMSVPQMFVFAGGEQKLRLTGFTPKEELVEKLKTVVS